MIMLITNDEIYNDVIKFFILNFLILKTLNCASKIAYDIFHTKNNIRSHNFKRNEDI
jgi:hypothetical protein